MISTSAIAILTYRRLGALQTMLQGLKTHCQGKYPIAVFEDFGNFDGTADYLSKGRVRLARNDLMADEVAFEDGITAYLGHQNLGVAGNSNRAIKWFVDSGLDHLCLCNDDLHVLGDFVGHYRTAHNNLDLGFFAFNDFWESPSHRWVICRSRGYRLRVFPRMTGIMMSVTRQAINKAGYFDTRFGKFGEEHCDWTNRLRFAGAMKLDGLDQVCIDVEPTTPEGQAAPPVLAHQNVATSVQGADRKREDELAAVAIAQAAQRYATEHYFRPFSLTTPKYIGGADKGGIKPEDAPKYKTVTCS